MSKVLTIVRHGKSDWSFNGLADFDRPLKARAYTDGYKMASKLKKMDPLPDLMLSSPANRALYTAMIYNRVLFGEFQRLQITEDLYLSGPRLILNKIRALEDAVQHVAIFGHNPGFTELANQFLPEYLDNIPTSGFVRLTFNTSKWSEISEKNLTGHIFEYPKKDLAEL